MKYKILGAVVFVAIAGVGTHFFIDHKVRSNVDAMLQKSVDDGTYEELYYENLSFTYNGEVTLDKLHVKQLGAEMIVEKLNINDMDFANPIPRHVNVKIDGIQFVSGLSNLNITGDTNIATVLDSIVEGEIIPVSINYQYNYEPEQSHKIDSYVDLSIPDMLVLKMSGSVLQLPLESLNEMMDPANSDPMAAQAQMLGLLTQAEIPRWELSIQDTGIIQTYLDKAAVDYNSTPEDFRNLLSSQVRNAYLFAPTMAQGVAMDAGIQVAEFLKGQRTLTVSIEPEFGGSITQLQPQIMGAVFTGDLNEVIKLLNFKLLTQE